jgi:signal transduction protein with GAF and PtsI domain
MEVRRGHETLPRNRCVRLVRHPHVLYGGGLLAMAASIGVAVMENDQWPEEEAAMTQNTYNRLCHEEGIAYAKAWLEEQCIHMHKVFDSDADRMRYDTELKRLANL